MVGECTGIGVSGIRYQVSGIRYRVSRIGYPRYSFERADRHTSCHTSHVPRLSAMDHPASFQSPLAWRLARQLVRNLYRLTASFPADEKYILVSQIRRAAHSVPSNIAEGRGRLSNGEWQHCLGQSRGSLLELESHVTIATDLGYCTAEASGATIKLIQSAARAVNGLLNSTRRPIAKKYKEPIPDTRYPIPDTRYRIPDTGYRYHPPP